MVQLPLHPRLQVSVSTILKHLLRAFAAVWEHVHLIFRDEFGDQGPALYQRLVFESLNAIWVEAAVCLFVGRCIHQPHSPGICVSAQHDPT